MSLETTPGKTISDFCGCSYTDAAVNHCAHFVCHFLKFDFGMNCFKLTRRGREGANVRVHEVFAQCPQVGLLDDWRGNGQVLAFVTEKRNVSLPNKSMRNVPKKHIGIYDGSHIYHYGNTRDKVVKQTVEEFKRAFQRTYGGDLGFYFGTLPTSTNGTVSPTPVTGPPAPPSATDVTYEIRGKDVFARIGGGEEFFVARRVPFGQRIGLMQRADQLTGPMYDPAPYATEFGPWAYMVYVIGVSESANRFNRINSYDRAAFTFGFFQMAAHTPKDNLVLFLRRATELPEFQTYFPELQMKDGRLHRIGGGTATDLEVEVFNPQHEERQLENLMRYLNPNERALDLAEIVHAAKLVDLCDKSQDFCKLQVRTAIQITTGKFRDRYQHWYDLGGISDTICVAIADIHHQGRGKKSQVRAALQSSNPVSALTKIGEDKWPERCASLRRSLAAFERDGKLGRHKYEPAHGVFVQV
ncbi:MAG TPA: hypothetical protein VJM12_22845 [Pyrinomonadaceae bacterium]|nr:hypothetical protein [Pyrinomonadaceae bacterium]